MPLHQSGRSWTNLLTRGSKVLWQPLGQPAPAADESKEPVCARPAGSECAEVLSLIFGVCTAIFLAKTVIAFRDLDQANLEPRLCDGWSLPSLGRIWACCAEDFAVGLGSLLLAALTLRLRAVPGYRWVFRVVVYLGAVAAICYMVLNVQVFHAMRQFLTWSLFQLGGGFEPERSVYEYATPGFKLAMALLPVAVIGVHLSLVRAFPGFWRRAAEILCRPLVLFLLILGLVAISQAAQQGLFPDAESDFAQNPHLLFARSFFRNTALDNDEGDDEQLGDVSDFLPGQPHHTPGLLAKPPTNIVLIVIESGGSLYMENYGAPFPTTPCLSRLRDRSLTFENFYATANNTVTSGLPILGSVYNDPTVLANSLNYPDYPMPAVSSWLKRQGYQTYFLASGGKRAWEGYRQGVLGRFFLREGFDLARDSNHPYWQKSPNPKRFLDDDYLDTAMFADAKNCLRAARGQKFFMTLWTYDAHEPYFPGDGPESFDEHRFPPAVVGTPEEERFRRYLRALWRTDALIGDLYGELERLGLADDTLVVVTGDHGEAWGQHGFFLHARFVYEEEVRVPLILISPRLAPLGTRSQVLGSHIDMWATITDVCGLPADPRWQGRSLLAGGPPEERRVYYHRLDYMGGVRQGKFKYIWDYNRGRHLLFDLDKDPGEKSNLADQHEEYCAEQYRRLRDWTIFQSRLTRQRLQEAGK
jgi:arylsulfatase A-like enzyme